MIAASRFDDLPVLGQLPPAQAIAKLRELGDHATADDLQAAQPRGRMRGGFSLAELWPLRSGPAPAFIHTAHAFGYVERTPSRTGLLSIQHPGNINADQSLKNSRIRVTLNRLRVSKYPGSGTHRILFDFYSRNQVADKTEELHFNATFRAYEGEEAAVIGYPIFVGLNVGADGIVFGCHTVNVANDDDQMLLDFLDSDIFKAGLHLASTLQPAIAPLTGMALGLTKAVGRRNQNISVQDFYIGLDFGNDPMGARLAEGAYLAVQIPQAAQLAWDWEEWGFNPINGQIVNRTDARQLVPYNYLVFGVGRYAGA